MVNIDIYMVNIDPLLARVANAAPGKDAEDFAAAALAAHRAAVNWALSIGAFKTAGTNANKRMGTVDTADLASGTYPVNAGPATVTGMAFTNVLKTPAEGMPAPRMRRATVGQRGNSGCGTQRRGPVETWM